jgi:acyl-coenzyme A thioesterase PaaI-like protein
MCQQIDNPFDDRRCFFCGPDNPVGLQLTFHFDKGKGETTCDYTPEQRFQGQGSVFHGGLQMGLLDEAMWWAGYAKTGIKEAVTANASFRFLRPVFIAQPVKVICKVKQVEGHSIRLTGAIINNDGEKCTTVKGEYRILSGSQYQTVITP